MVLHVFTSFVGGVPLCIPYGLYSGTSLGGTTRGTLEGYPGRVLSSCLSQICCFFFLTFLLLFYKFLEITNFGENSIIWHYF